MTWDSARALPFFLTAIIYLVPAASKTVSSLLTRSVLKQMESELAPVAGDLRKLEADQKTTPQGSYLGPKYKADALAALFSKNSEAAMALIGLLLFVIPLVVSNTISGMAAGFAIVIAILVGIVVMNQIAKADPQVYLDLKFRLWIVGPVTLGLIILSCLTGIILGFIPASTSISPPPQPATPASSITPTPAVSSSPTSTP